MVDLSPEAVDRAQRSILAAPVFAAHAELIGTLTPDLPTDQVLVAVVDAEYLLAGTYVIARDELVERVPELEGSGWAMVFSHRSDAEQVRYRAGEMALLAEKRITMIARLRRKQDLPPLGGDATTT